MEGVSQNEGPQGIGSDMVDKMISTLGAARVNTY